MKGHLVMERLDKREMWMSEEIFVWTRTWIRDKSPARADERQVNVGFVGHTGDKGVGAPSHQFCLPGSCLASNFEPNLCPPLRTACPCFDAFFIFGFCPQTGKVTCYPGPQARRV